MKLKSTGVGTLSPPPAPVSVSAPLRPSIPSAPQTLTCPPPAALAPLESLVRKLVASADSVLPPPPAAHTFNGSVIATAEMDGVRYVLVRCQPKPAEALLSLSPRERDIVNLVIKGYPNKMIADLLEISAWTVGTHLRRIFAKLGVTSRAAMVARYLNGAAE